MNPDRCPTVAVVGAGCAGTLTAVQLLRRGAGRLRVVLIDRTGTFGPGVAYSTDDERHLLNVVAERMSAFPDEPGHFAAWVRGTGRPAPRGAFLPRALYGEYLQALLDEAERAGAAAGRSLVRIHGEAVDVEPSSPGGRSWVVLADRWRIAADHVVLALGSLRGAPPVALPDDPRVVADPWAPGALHDLPPGAVTLLVGSGLTAVDVALSHCARDPRARTIAVSRGGCLPFDQLPGVREPVPATAPPPPAPATVASLERWMRLHVSRTRRAGHDWRDALDGIRPQAARLWQSLPPEEQRRFVHEHARAWELRRHRMAPEIAEQVRALLRSGRLLVRAGRIVAVRALDETLEVLVASGAARDGGAPPSRDATLPSDAFPAARAAEPELRTLRVQRVVLCAGPGGDVHSADSPLVQALLARGLAAPDALALGMRATADGALVGADGGVRPSLHLLGPLRRGELWETTAVGEIRQQAQRIAAAIAG